MATENKSDGSNSMAFFWIILIIIAGVIWFNNTHPSTHYNGLEDYRDTWFTGTERVRALYCGKYPNTYCDPSGNWFVTTATWQSKEKAASEDTEWIHYFTLYFPNGGWVETEATCDKAAEGYYSYKRFCRATAYDDYGNEVLYIIAPID